MNSNGVYRRVNQYLKDGTQPDTYGDMVLYRPNNGRGIINYVDREVVDEISTRREPTEESLKNARHIMVLIFLSNIISNFENDIYESWTRWSPITSNIGLVDSLKYFFDTILYEPLNFVVSNDGDQLEFFENRPTFRIGINIFGTNIRTKYIDEMISKKSFSGFFKYRTVDSNHKIKCTDFLFNDILEKGFDREGIFKKLVLKLLFRSICLNDGGYTYSDMLMILTAIFQKMFLDQENLLKKPGNIEIIKQLYNFISTPGLFAGLTSLAPKHFLNK